MSGGLRDAGLQKPVNRRLGEVLGGAGVSTMGNTAGTTGTVFGPVVLVGVSGVSLSQSTRGNRATISIAASAENGVAIGAGTQTQLTGTVIFSNSNGITFGLSNGTLTAVNDAARVLAVRDATGGETQLGFKGNTIGFSGENGISFGTRSGVINSVSYITASVSREPSIAAGTQTASSGTVVFSNSNGVSFGLSNGTLTASVAAVAPQISFWDASAAGELAAVSAEVTRLLFQRINIANQIAATRAQLMMAVSNSNNAGGTVAFSFGVYTMSGSTASLASSASRTWAYNSTLTGFAGANSSYADIAGTNYRSMTLGTWNLTPGDYLFALQFRLTTALTSGSYNWLGGHNLSVAGYDYSTGPIDYFNHGKLSVSTAAFPATVHPTVIKGANFDDAAFFPYFQLIGTF